jgi:hypothetical protein
MELLPKQHATSRCGTRAAGGNPRSWRTDGTRAELVTVTVPASAGASGRSGHTQAQAGTGRNASLGRICVGPWTGQAPFLPVRAGYCARARPLCDSNF